MHTDWLIVRRLGAELGAALRGGRVTDAGMLDDGRLALRFGNVKGPSTLAFDVFGTPPLVTLEDAELAVGADPGFARAAGTALRGMRLIGVTTRRGDRLMALEFGARTRFGVGSESRLIAELVPRFGNLLLLKGPTIVAALKQFSPAENAARSIQVGGAYESPPLPEASLERDGFVRALGDDPQTWVRALGKAMPLVPRLVAESFAAAAASIPWVSKEALADWLLTRAAALLSAADGVPQALGDIFVYRREGAIIEAHVVPLTQFGEAEERREPALLPVVAAVREQRRAAGTASTLDRRRTAFVRRVQRRIAALTRERERVLAKRDDAQGRERLREWGESLYTHLHEVPPEAQRFKPQSRPGVEIELDPELDAKDNAARFFARYRKLTDALPHLEERLTTIAGRLASFESLAWEAERADSTTLSELEAAADELEGRRVQAAPAAKGRRSGPLQTDRPSGARIYVGRSPAQNVDLTFRLARPDDLWFHARNIPGAHVVLRGADGTQPDDDDVAYAADLAALHSKAATSERVDVDYTQRKHVRKQRDAAPGLVWYTHFKTIVGRPERARPV